MKYFQNQQPHLSSKGSFLHYYQTKLYIFWDCFACNKNQKLYYLNDYHYLLLYDTLQDFCVLQNDFVQEAKTKKEKDDFETEIFGCDLSTFFQDFITGRLEQLPWKDNDIQNKLFDFDFKLTDLIKTVENYIGFTPLSEQSI